MHKKFVYLHPLDEVSGSNYLISPRKIDNKVRYLDNH